MCENSFNIISGDLPKFPKRSFLFVVVVCSLVHNAIRLFALGAMGFACRLYLSHYPLRFITSNSLFALASTIRKTKRLSRRQVAILIFLPSTFVILVRSVDGHCMRRTRTRMHCSVTTFTVPLKPFTVVIVCSDY